MQAPSGCQLSVEQRPGVNGAMKSTIKIQPTKIKINGVTYHVNVEENNIARFKMLLLSHLYCHMDDETAVASKLGETEIVAQMQSLINSSGEFCV